MSVKFQNYIAGTTDADLLSGGTSLSSAGLADLMAVSGGSTVWLALDADASAGAPEIVSVTAHTASATTCTISRAQQGTTARSHSSGTDWALVVTASDLDELPYRKVTAKGDVLVASGAGAVTNLAAGTNGYPLVANSSATNGVNYAQLATAGLADSSVTSAKIVDGTIATGDLADSSVSTAKLADSAVTTVKITDANVTTGKLADDAVTAAKLADSAVDTAAIVDSAVTSAKIADGTIVAGDLASSVTDLFTPTTWTAPTLTAFEWINFGGGYQPMQYRKVGDMVQLRGVLASAGGGDGSTIFTLPSGFRPPSPIQFIVRSGSGAAYIQINELGVVSYHALLSDAPASGVLILQEFSTSS